MNETISKVIKFYKIYINNTVSYNGDKLDNCIYDIFLKTFTNINTHTTFYNDLESVFEIFEFDCHHLFATFSKTEKISPTSFLQNRDLSTQKTTPFHLSDTNRLETYTYLYIDFNKKIMTVLSNRKLSKLNEVLSKYIIEKHSKMNSIVDINILPMVVDNIERKLSSFNKIKELSYKFVNSYYSPDNMPSLHKLFGNDIDVKEGRIVLKLSGTKHKLISKLSSLTKQSDYNIDILAENDLGIDETINLFETLFIKSVSIKISDTDVENYENIKNILLYNIENLY